MKGVAKPGKGQRELPAQAVTAAHNLTERLRAGFFYLEKTHKAQTERPRKRPAAL